MYWLQEPHSLPDFHVNEDDQNFETKLEDLTKSEIPQSHPKAFLGLLEKRVYFVTERTPSRTPW